MMKKIINGTIIVLSTILIGFVMIFRKFAENIKIDCLSMNVS